jgi:CRP/FNR family transcriptional regulator, cyclic AMP receptor protein
MSRPPLCAWEGNVTTATQQVTRDEAQIIRALPFLRSLPEPDLERVIAAVRRRTYRKGDLIHHEDDLAGDCFVVVRGQVKHRLTALDGRQITHKFSSSGVFFGMISVLDHKRRAGDAVAVTDCELMVIDGDLIAEIRQKHPSANAALLEFTTTGVRHVLGLLHDLAFLSVPMRLAKVLLQFAEEDAQGLYIPAYLNQMELAFLVATTRESVNQTLKRFAREGWVTFDRRLLRITDAEGLRRSISD